jgi:hypothetical protein
MNKNIHSTVYRVASRKKQLSFYKENPDGYGNPDSYRNPVGYGNLDRYGTPTYWKP